MFKRFFKMGINRTDKQVGDNDNLVSFNEKEANFIIAKLRQAPYQGTEFETFYQVILKLQKIAEKKQ